MIFLALFNRSVARRAGGLVLIAGLSAAGACSARPSPHEPPERPKIAGKSTTARQEPLDTLYRASGTVRGKTTAVLTSKTTGYIRTVDVRPGDKVRAGQVLATLEANDSAASVRRARAGLDQSLESRAEAENALKAAQSSLRIAKATYDRMSSLHASRAIPQQQFDEAEAAYNNAVAQEQMAQARLRASASRIDQAKAEIGEAQATLDYARIVAPFAGQITERRVDPGNLASPGMALLVVEQEGKLRVEAPVEESRAASIALGDTATVELESLGKPAIGTVGEIVPMVDVASRAFLVKIDLAEELPSLRPGMFARVGFRVGSKPRLVVPSTAVSKLGALDRVFAIDGERVRIRMVTLGEKQGPWTEVLSGLAPGERIVAAVTPELRDGAHFVEQP